MKVVEESRLCGGTDFGVHIQLTSNLPGCSYLTFLPTYTNIHTYVNQTHKHSF